jgi:hypothetical protein
VTAQMRVIPAASSVTRLAAASVEYTHGTPEC